MKNRKLCIYISSNNFFDNSIKKIAKRRNLDIEIIKFDFENIFNESFSKRTKNFKKIFKRIGLKNLEMSRLIFDPYLILPKKIFDDMSVSSSVLVDPICISLAFSSICKKHCDNRIIFIGSVKGYDFKELSLKGENSINQKLLRSFQLDGSLETTTKFLALNFAKYDIKVNAAMFGPIKNIDDLETVKFYNQKSITQFPVSLKDIEDSLDLFVDPLNEYMTGQVIKFDGGISIW